MNTTPRRPRLNTQQVEEAIKDQVSEAPFSASEFAQVYSHRKDSYEMAKDIEKESSCDICRDDLDTIEELMYSVEKAQEQLVKKWFEENNIQAPYPVGTRITHGLIAGIYEYEPAVYKVKIDGCTDNSRYRLIRFEDAQTGDH